MRRRPPVSPLFPYTTLFRSGPGSSAGADVAAAAWERSACSATSTFSRSRAKVEVAEQAERSQARSEEHTSELQSRGHLVCRLLLEKKNKVGTYHEASPCKHM